MIKSKSIFPIVATVTVLIISACGGGQESATPPTVSTPVTPENQPSGAASATPLPASTSTQIPRQEPTAVPPASSAAPTPSPATATAVPTRSATSPSTATPAPATAAAPATGFEGLASVSREDLPALIMSNPEIMRCLTGVLAMSTLLELVQREPTAEEMGLIIPCLSGFLDEQVDEDAFVVAEWQKRIDAAFTPVACEVSSQSDYPSSYYKGPLIDTHFHIPQLPDDGFFGVDGDNVESKGVDAELYDSIAEEDVPRLGRTVNINAIACTLQREGTIRVFAFFPAFLDIQVQLVEVARRTMEEYPSLFVPFIQSSGSEVSTVEAETLQEFLEIHPGLFFGLGEVGDSPTEPINPPPDSVIYTENFEVARNHSLAVYFHVGEGHHENLGRALQRFPDITFIVHGDGIRPFIDGMMDQYPNLYFTFNNIFEEHTPLFRFGEKAVFISALKDDWDRLLEAAVEDFGPLIESHPDRYMWGTDRGDIVWNYDEDIGQLIAEYGRAFIGKFDPEVQEKIAYKNAELLVANN